MLNYYAMKASLTHKKPITNLPPATLTNWNRHTNPFCKFTPGNRVRIVGTKAFGKVVAVSSVDGSRIVNTGPGRDPSVPTRGWATYYVKRKGKVYSYNSAELEFSPYYA